MKLPDKNTELSVSEANKLFDTGWWENKSGREIVEFQLYHRLLCLPSKIFHRATEKVLGRDVWTHEFFGENRRLLIDEFEGKIPAPDIFQVMTRLVKLATKSSK